MAPAQARAADPAPPATPSFGAEVSPADPAPWELCSGIDLLPAAMPAFGAGVGSVAAASPAPLARSDRGATSFGAEAGLPGGGPSRLWGEALPEPTRPGTVAGTALSAVCFADCLVAERNTVFASDSWGRRGSSAAAATCSAVSRAAVPDEPSAPAESDFRFRRGGRLGS